MSVPPMPPWQSLPAVSAMKVGTGIESGFYFDTVMCQRWSSVQVRGGQREHCVLSAKFVPHIYKFRVDKTGGCCSHRQS